jgi:2-polyprenyl-3-methyl-5-hydroxy-6-metoxy-1,4-benzoquinol methylase
MTDGSNIINLIDKNLYNSIENLFKKTSINGEFEFIFSNKDGKYITQEKYIKLLKYLQIRKSSSKLNSIGPIEILDINFTPDKETTYRVTLEGDNINEYLKKVDLWKSHVIFKTFVNMSHQKEDKNITIMKKTKETDNTIDIFDLNMRVRLSDETKFTKSDFDLIDKIDYTSQKNISFRLKQRFSLFTHKTSDDFVRIDITATKTTRNYKDLNNTYSEFELEVEYGKTGKNTIPLTEIYKEVSILHKIIQQSNFIITNSKSEEVIKYYKKITNSPESSTFLNARQPISFELQYLSETVPNKYAVTDKADGERYFLVIFNGRCYYISTNLNVKDSGIDLKTKDYDATIMDGEYIFIPKQNRHLYMVFDILINCGKDLRNETKFFNRISEAENLIKKIFVFDKQKGFLRKEYVSKGEFNLDYMVKFYEEQIKQSMDSLNHDMQYSKQFPLIRAKYFIGATGACRWDIYRFSEMMYKKYTEDSSINCPYVLDGLIFQPLEQAYVTNARDSKYFELKWKPPHSNSIDFYITFEKDKNTGKPITIYDNSNDDFVRNKPYRICKLHVGKRINNKETPVLFNEANDGYWAYLFVENGEVRDEEGNIVTDGTVVEFYYNSDEGEEVFIPDKFRWKIMRTRYDKTESVQRYQRRYGNADEIALKVWRSIRNPVLMEDFKDLSKGNNPDKNQFFYDKKLEMLQKKIGKEMIVSAAKQNAFYQKITNLASAMRQFHNWIKSNVMYTYCNKIYQNNKQLSILDVGVGRGGDLLRYYYAEAAFVVGFDVSKDGLYSPINGAVSRYNEQRKRKANFPKMYFIHADGSVKLNYDEQYKALGGMNMENKQLFEKFFQSEKNSTKFDVISCQNALHYFLKDDISWENFKSNINQTLRNGGYFMVTHMDAKKVIKALENKSTITYEYTDDEGNKQKLFEIIKKYDDTSIKKEIGLGNPIELFASWMFEDGNFMTEYLVDVDFLKKDLLKSCQLELIETDTFENQYTINKEFFKDGIYKFEPNLETRDFLDKVSKYYEKSEINDTCKVFTNLWRFSIFRKKDSNQVGGKVDLTELKKFSVPKMEGYDNDFTLQNSIHHILQTHNIIPNSILEDELFHDLNIRMKEDAKYDEIELKKLLRKIKIEHQISEDKFKTVVDGIDICTFERNGNNQYRSNLIKCGKDNAKIITLIKEGELYKPLYITIDNQKSAIFEQDNTLLNELIKKT